MSMPRINQTTRRIHVGLVRVSIKPSDIRIPMIGVKGTHGALNGRSRSGLRRRRIHTPAETMTNASSVPMLTISVSTLIGKDAARAATKNPTVRVEIQGVRKRGWTELNIRGNNPSRDMEKKTRD